ncbi:D-3-phosphoglycerate dehydrogenase [Lasiodiplodia hormozganensis]|uniref:D-3-phosphoglycerate dehydrogenase n=1 Tax=Lasiodiplodia hormozganensis TaxID=869390 RepID=A0AA40CJR6_9PEZI|nr:D-3-phosphoglycerate dehydrogenase [Lasiodiplodia hormozganensis]
MTTTTPKPTLYLLESFPAAAIRHAQTLFPTVVLPSDPEIANWRASATAILVREQPITAADIAAASTASPPRLRAIGKQGTGIDIIDAGACAARGIAILNTPGVNAGAVAELALALALAAARQLRRVVVGQVAAGGREMVRKEHCAGVTLAGKAVGVVGMGAVGTAVARMFVGAFGARVWACDPVAPKGAWADVEHVRVGTLEEMLPHVDVLTLHVPLTAETRGMVGMRELRLMRREAILVNVSRGGIVDEEALLRALEEGLIWGAGLDCHEEEPPTLAKYEALWATGKVISTPHIGATTAETQVRTAMAAINNIHRYLSSGRV